jgi:hypothetical protein
MLHLADLSIACALVPLQQMTDFCLVYVACAVLAGSFPPDEIVPVTACSTVQLILNPACCLLWRAWCCADIVCCVFIAVQVIVYAQLERIVQACSADTQQHMQLPRRTAAAPADELQQQQQQQQHAEVPLQSELEAAVDQAAAAAAVTGALQAPQQQQPIPDPLLQLELEAEEDEAAVSFKAAGSVSAVASAAPAAARAEDACSAQALQQQQQQQQQHVHQYSIVYHDTYRVPVLYVRACEPSGRPLSLSQLLRELPALQQYSDASQADWTFITQVVRRCCCCCCCWCICMSWLR